MSSKYVYSSELSTASIPPALMRRFHFTSLLMTRRRGGRNISKGYKGEVPQQQPRDGVASTSTGASSAPQRPKRPPLTHFLCVPLVNESSRPQLERSLAHFREDIAKSGSSAESETNPEDTEGVTRDLAALKRPEGQSNVHDRTASRIPCIPESAVRPVGALHLTIGVMSLTTPEKIEAAFELLNEMNIVSAVSERSEQSESNPEPKQEATTELNAPSGLLSKAVHTLKRAVSPPPLSHEREDSPGEGAFHGNDEQASSGTAQAVSQGERGLNITVSLRSLLSMHPAKKTSILYAAPDDPSSLLLPLCKHLQSRFTDADLLVKDDRPLKLHATVLNTIYAKRSPGGGSGHGRNAKAPVRIDATALLEQYHDFVWAEEIRLEKIAICKMGAKKILDANGRVVHEAYEEVASLPLMQSGT